MTSTQTDLRFNSISDNTSDRWQAVIHSGKTTERASRMLAIALEACEAAGPAGLQTKLFRGCLWIRCEQDRLAELLECSDRSVRREFQRLESLGVLKRVEHDDLPNVVAWAISLDGLESIQPSATPELDDLIYGCPDPFGSCDDRGAMPTRLNEFGPVSGGLSAPLSTGLSGGLSAPLIMKHDHEHDLYKTHEHAHEHEFFENSEFESQETQPGESQISNLKSELPPPTAVSFSEISETDVRRIVREFDRDLFERYFSDTVSAHWARDCLDDRQRMAGLFNQVLRIGKARSLGRTISAAWRHRDSPDTHRGKPKALKLSQADQDFAARLLRPPRQREPLNIKPLKTPFDGDTDGLCLSAAEIQRQQTVQRGNLAVLQRIHHAPP